MIHDSVNILFELSNLYFGTNRNPDQNPDRNRRNVYLRSILRYESNVPHEQSVVRLWVLGPGTSPFFFTPVCEVTKLSCLIQTNHFSTHLSKSRNRYIRNVFQTWIGGHRKRSASFSRRVPCRSFKSIGRRRSLKQRRSEPVFICGR